MSGLASKFPEKWTFSHKSTYNGEIIFLKWVKYLLYKRKLPMNVRYQKVLKRLKEERLRLGWSQWEISFKLQMEQSHYSKAELGAKRFTYYELQRLGKTGVDIHYMYTGKRLEEMQVEMLRTCTYSELFYFVEILYAQLNFLRDKDKKGKWNRLLNSVGYMKYASFPHKKNDNVLFLLRQYLGETQYEMAEILDMDVKRLRHFETGKILPDSETIWKLYELYQIPPTVILKDNEGLIAEICYVLDQLEEPIRSKVIAYLENGKMLLREIGDAGRNGEAH